MATRCVFCGKNLSFFDGKTLLCGNTIQRVCPACWDGMQELDQEERAHRALDTGRAEGAETIRAFLDSQEQKRRTMAQAREAAREALKTDKRCLRCGGVMERYGRRQLHLGEESLFGTVARDGLFASWLTVDILRCADCGKAEFYLPEPPELEYLPKAPEAQVVCPVCGTRYPAGTQCPACARERTDRAANTTRKKEEKPPWEK